MGGEGRVGEWPLGSTSSLVIWLSWSALGSLALQNILKFFCAAFSSRCLHPSHTVPRSRSPSLSLSFPLSLQFTFWFCSFSLVLAAFSFSLHYVLNCRTWRRSHIHTHTHTQHSRTHQQGGKLNELEPNVLRFVLFVLFLPFATVRLCFWRCPRCDLAQHTHRHTHMHAVLPLCAPHEALSFAY